MVRKDTPIVVTNGFANVSNALGQGIFGDYDIVPNRADDVVLAYKMARILSKQPQHSKGPGPNIYMLARGVSQLIRVEINHMTWQSHFTLHGPMAGHGTIPGGLPNFLPLFPRRKGFFLEGVASKQTPLLFAIGDLRAGSTKARRGGRGRGAAVVSEIHHVVAAEPG